MVETIKLKNCLVIFQESVFTFRRGRLPPVKPTAAPTIGTSPSSLEDEDIGGIEIGGDLGDEEENLFYQGQAQRLIPNHVFESPSLPIRQQVCHRSYRNVYLASLKLLVFVFIRDKILRSVCLSLLNTLN
jgi:hypothetical protein